MLNLTAIGSLGRDSDVRELQNGKVVNFSIGVSIGFGEQKSTQWIECNRWGDKTGISEYLKKGVKVFVSGQPSIVTYEKDGKTNVSLRLNVSEIELLGDSKKSSE